MDLQTPEHMNAHAIALVDDHHLMRAALTAMINELPGYQVCIEAANGREFIDALDSGPTPLIAVVDLHMPVLNGYDTIAWLRQHKPGILPLALTFDTQDDAMARAVRNGARGFLRKDARPRQLHQALDELRLTGYYHTDDVQQEMLENGARLSRSERERQRVVDQISPREMEFLRLVCDEAEHTYHAIAALMEVQPRTVENYRTSLCEKFGLRSKTGIVLFAMRWNLLEDQPAG